MIPSGVQSAGNPRKQRGTVYLIGDSIRLNAEPVVRSLLGDVALSSPREKCESSTQVRERIGAWAPAARGDLVHLNCGLHDLRHDPGAQGPVNTLDDYADNLEAIFSRLADTDVIVVWATSTPFDEQRHNATKASRRHLADLLRYNTLSVRMAEAYGFVVHDLHAAMLRHPLQELLLPDGLHFNHAGNVVVGAEIARVILERLPK